MFVGEVSPRRCYNRRPRFPSPWEGLGEGYLKAHHRAPLRCGCVSPGRCYNHTPYRGLGGCGARKGVPPERPAPHTV